MKESPSFLLVLVDARQLDYSSCKALATTMRKHPYDGSKNGDIGHAWIYLEGCVDGQAIAIEGGHSGERGVVKPRYCDGIMSYFEKGDPNPVRYIGESLGDGYFQNGSGGHKPTFAIKIELKEEEIRKVLEIINVYDFCDYSVTNHQCCTFVEEIAASVGLLLDPWMVMHVESSAEFRGVKLQLWCDERYSRYILPTPEKLEESMLQAVKQGHAESALNWYRQKINNQL